MLFNFLLPFFLFVLFLIDYFFIAKKILFTPSLIIIASFFLATIIFSTNYWMFSTVLEINTIVVICVAIIFEMVGEYLGRDISLKRHRKIKFFPCVNKHDNCLMIVPNIIMFIIWIVMFFVLYCRIKSLMKIASMGGGASLLRASGFAREYLLTHENVSINTGPIVNQMFVFCKCFAYYCAFAFFNNYIKFKKISIRYVITIILVSIQILCDTSRSSVMNFFITIMFMFVFHIYACNKWKVFSNRKVFKIIIISFFMVMFLFSALAILTSREGISKIENIIKYIGSPIVGLNYYLNSSHIPNIIWGQETLYYFYQLLREWGADIPWYKWHHEFYSYGINSTSNLYTGLRRAIQDFGVLGMFLTRFVLGIFYMKLFTKIRRFNSSDYNNIPIIIFCCMLCVPLAMMSITDAIPEYISTSTFYTLFYLYFIKVSGMFKLQAEVK